MSRKRKKVVVSVERKIKIIQRLDKDEILRIVTTDCGVEPNTVDEWPRNRANLEQTYISNESFMVVVDLLSVIRIIRLFFFYYPM